MRKIKKSLVALLLLVSVIFSFASCQYVDVFLNKNQEDNGGLNNEKNETKDEYKEDVWCICCRERNDGYTGGVTSNAEFHEKYGVYWLETYEEVLEAVELLKSHDSTIDCTLAFDYEGELFDSKFCFWYEKEKAEIHEEGKSFFDRKIDGGKFEWFGFYDDITIEEMMYNTDIDSIDVVYFEGAFQTVNFSINYNIVKTIENVDNLSFYWKYLPKGDSYPLYYNKKSFATVIFDRAPFSYEYHNELLNTFVIIE